MLPQVAFHQGLAAIANANRQLVRRFHKAGKTLGKACFQPVGQSLPSTNVVTITEAARHGDHLVGHQVKIIRKNIVYMDDITSEAYLRKRSQCFRFAI